MRRLGPMVLCLITTALVAGCGGGGGVERDGGGAIVTAADIGPADLRAGDCFDQGADQTVATVNARPCGEPHTNEVFVVLTYAPPSGAAGDAFPGLDALNAFADAACGQAFTAYVGRPADQSALNYATLVPSEEGWKQGDRYVTCSAFTDDGSPLTGSVRGRNA